MAELTPAPFTQPTEPLSPIRWALAAAIAAPAAIFAHEMAHYLMAQLVGAEHIGFDWVAIKADTSMLGSKARGAIGIAGPVMTVALIAGARIYSQSRFSPIVWAVGLTSGFRSLVSLAYFIRTIIGSADGGNFAFDEYEAGNDFGISPMFFVVPSLAVFIYGTGFFGRRMWRRFGSVPS